MNETASDDHPSAKRVSTLAALRPAICLGSLFPIAAYCLSFFARQSWLLDLLCNFQVQFFVAIIFFAVVSMLLKRWKWAMLNGLFLLASGWSVLSGPLTPAIKPATDSKRLTIVSANLLHSNHEHERAKAEFRRLNPDILVLVEYTPHWAKSLDISEDEYPYRIVEPRSKGAGIAIFSKYQLHDVSSVDVSSGKGACSMLHTRVKLEGKVLHLFGVHPLSPRRPFWRDIRDEQLRQITAQVNQYVGEKLVIGDFNATVWTPTLQDFAWGTKLVDTRNGFGIFPSWPLEPWPARITIDHAFASRGIGIARRGVGNDIGSDHLPIVVEIGLADSSLSQD